MERREPFFGTCPCFNKEAEIIVALSGHKNPQDLQPTYRPYGHKCSLLSQGKLCPLIDCPLIPKDL